MKRWLVDYFTNPSEVTFPARVFTIVLAVILFIVIFLLGPVIALQASVFNPDYFASYVDDIDISALAHDWFNESVAPANPLAAKVAEFAVIQFEPQIKHALHFVIRNVHAFILNRLEKGRLLETIAEKKHAEEDFITNLNSVVEIPALKLVFDAFSLDPKLITDSIDIDQIDAYFDAIGRMAQYQAYVVAAKNSFIPLVIILPLLIIGIIFTARKVRLIFSTLGIVFLAYGVIQFFGMIVARGYINPAVRQLTTNSFVNSLALKFVGDITGTFLIYSGVFLFLGVLLTTMYFFVLSPEK